MSWPTIDLIPSCANAAFVEFASAQYRHLDPDWSFFAAVFAADMLYIPFGPGYWEYDSTTSFIGQLAGALEDLAAFEGALPDGKITLPKSFYDIRFLLTRYEPDNELHRATFDQGYEEF